MNYSFIRFLLVGVVNTIVGLAIMFILLHLAHLTYWVATSIGNFVGAVVSYVLNRSFTFHSKKSIATTWYRFILVILVCYLVAFSIGRQLAVITMGLLPYSDAMQYINDVGILIGTAIYVVLNYIGQKLLVFH